VRFVNFLRKLYKGVMRISCDLLVCFYFLRKLDAVLSCLYVCLFVCFPLITFEPIGGFRDTYYAHHTIEDNLTSTVMNSLSSLFLRELRKLWDRSNTTVT